MTRRLLTIIIFLTVTAMTVIAENYTVYSVHGKVWERTDHGNVAISQRATHLTDDTQIVIGRGGALTLYLGESRRLITLKERGIQRLATLVKRSNSGSKSTGKWVSSLMGSLIKSETPEQTHRRVLQSQGGSHRGEDDEKALANAFAHYLAAPRRTATTPISFEVLDGDDDAQFISVTNHSDRYMFVNVVIVSAQGRSLLLPVDPDADNNCCAHLCVPPNSTVDFTELCFFQGWDADARLIMIASPKEVNFTVLCDDSVNYDSSTPIADVYITE